MENLLISGNTNEMNGWNVDDIISNKFSNKDNYDVLELYRKESWIENRDWYESAHLNERLK